MRKKVFAVTIFILTFVLALSCGVGLVASAATAPQFALSSITALDSTNNRIDFNLSEQKYGREIIATFSLTQPKYKYEVYLRSGATFDLIKTSALIVSDNGKAEINIINNGEVKVTVYEYNLHEVQQGAPLSVTVFSDNKKPYDIEVDSEELNKYHIAPFNVKYKILRDAESQINFTESYYKINAIDGTPIVEKTLFNNSYDEKFIYAINYNCVITMALFDNAGNKTEKSYTYNKHGMPVSEVPKVTVTPSEGFTQRANVAISWGASYDKNPYASKYYVVTNSAGTMVKTKYIAPFTIDKEDTTIVVYYFIDNVEHSLSVEIDNVDVTPPSAKLLEETLLVTINAMAPNPIHISVMAQDSKSGILKVYLDSGEIFTNVAANKYSLDTKTLANFTIYAQDKAGNKASFGYYAATNFDNATLTEYNAKFLTLNSDDYCQSGWDNVVKSYNALSAYLISDNISTSEIAIKKRVIDTAIKGDIIITTVIATMPEGLDIISFDVPASSTALKKGETAKIIINRVLRTAEDLATIKTQLFSESGYPNPQLFGMRLNLVNANGDDVVITGDIVVKIATPKDKKEVKVYCANADNTFSQANSTMVDGAAVVTIGKLSELFIVYDLGVEKPAIGLTIGDKFYSWQLLTTTAGIIIGVGLVGFLVVFLLFRAKKK